jgi:hypothetical protein
VVVPRASDPVFMFYAPELFFSETEGVDSRFHILRSQTHFWLYRGRQVSFSCFALPDSFLMVPRTSGLVCIFCAPGLVFDGFEGVGSRLHVLHSRIRFGRYRGRRVIVSYFVLSNPFWAVPRASGPIFIFCTTRLVFDGTEGAGSRFHVLRSRTHFRRYRGRRVPFACFAHPDSFSTIPRGLGPVFMFCAPGLVFDGTEDVGSRLHVLRSRTRLRWYRGRWVPFLCFAVPYSF